MTNEGPRFADRLAERIGRVGSPVCVGLDPVLDRLPQIVRAEHWEPTAAIASFCRVVIDAVADLVPAVKPQSACFERYGAKGVAALEHVCAHAKQKGLIVVLDAKRGDIGLSAEHYAASARHLGIDAITLNAFLGTETIEPYLDAGLGVFVLVRTSNPGSDEIQSPRLEDGRTVAQLMADRVAALGDTRVGKRGLSDVGAVVGATKTADAAALRERMPDQVFLAPGYGVQGGTADDIRAMCRPNQPPATAGVLVAASRSVIYAKGDDWKRAVADAASEFAADVASIFESSD